MNARDTVLAMLEEAANAGLPCPTNVEITEALDFSSMSTAPDIIARLERDGQITVERGIRSRVVTIVATGNRTAGQITTPHWSVMGKSAREASNAYRMAVLDMMVRAADAGATPPEYGTIAADLNISSTYACKIVKWLIEHNLLRRTEPGLYQFEIVGTGKTTAAGRRVGAAADGLRDRDRELLDYLRQFIGRPLPKNPDIAAAIRGLHPATISSVLSALEASGKVTVRREGQHRILVAIERKPEALAEDTLRHVDNRVCGYCGTRAAAHDQFGCRRSMAA